ncbi:MAG: NADH:flavin oxidoreductase / NADH oxidase [Rhodospirillaceae bacterium TMED8]|nr:NADH:flavin oxidoreductase / NADH oxidase [Magnetovibrio sp.]OUT48925.1 MAG: NADH:flavin oxidoreductase / NADH oxidase [Rhodospirillaceae bacterium TMED8]
MKKNVIIEKQSAVTNNKVPLLFQPISIRGVELPNRVVVAPMCQYHSDDGEPTDWQIMHLGRLAAGGAGLVFGEETAVERRGRKTYACAGLYKKKHVKAYLRLTNLIREQGAVPAIQLGHAGRKASCHTATESWRPLIDQDSQTGYPPWQGLAPSALNQLPRHFLPKEMDRDDIKTVIEAFRVATHRSLDAGYDVIEIHGAHGYLIHQFLSPVSNHRKDSYGGDLAGRMRFALEVAEVVRSACPDRPVFYRISAVDGEGGIWSLPDSISLSQELKSRHIDLIDVSSGGISGGSTMPPVPRIPGYQVGFCERIKRDADVMTIAVGGITKAQQAEDILRASKADLIALARELLWNADWPVHAAHELGIKDPFFMIPNEYAFRLRQREEQKTIPINQGGDKTNAAMRFLLGDNHSSNLIKLKNT